MVATPKLVIGALSALVISSGVSFGFTELAKRNENFRELVEKIEEKLKSVKVGDVKSCIWGAIDYFMGEEEAYKTAFRKCVDSITFETRLNRYSGSTGGSDTTTSNWSEEKVKDEVKNSKAAKKLGKDISTLENSTDFCNKIKELSNKDFNDNDALEKEWNIYLRVCKGNSHQHKTYW